MRILTIRGQNLASLESFEVELESGALAHVGIFAITGPTGAGKTTLLDALCVALFDRTPRLSNLAGVPVGTVDQEEGLRVRANDVRGMLRRGAGQGFAEVDFIGKDGRRYRAKWSVHRSRKRATGKLQNSEISLTDLEAGQVFAGKKRETLEAIESKLGLSFEQFSRSALLAQNDFAAFLRADKEQRSDLLERMTGTEIYTKVSIAAYRRAVDESKNLSALEEKADSSAIQDDEERERLEAKRSELRKNHTEVRTSLQKAQAAMRWFAEYRNAQEAVTAAETSESKAKQSLGALAETRKRVAAVRVAREQRGIVNAAMKAEEQLASASKRQQQADKEQQSAEIKAADSKEAVAHAKTAVEAARTTYIESLKLEQANTAARMETLASWLEAHKDLAAAGGESPKLAKLSPEELDAIRPDLEERVANTLREAERCRTVELGALEARKVSKSASDRASANAASGNLAALRAKHAQLTQQQGGVQQLRNAVETQTRAATQRTRAEVDAEKAKQEVQRLEGEYKVHASDEKVLVLTLGEAEGAYDRIRLALDLSEHRAKLVDGEHCPLCGSEEHPWQKHDATSSVVAEQESRVRELRASLEDHRSAGAELSTLLRAQEHVGMKAVEEAKSRDEEALSAKKEAEAERKKPPFDDFDLPLGDDDLPNTARKLEARLARAREELTSAEELDAEAREAATAATMAAARWAVASEKRQEAELQHQDAKTQLSACQGYRYRSRAAQLSTCRQAGAVCEEKLAAAPSWNPEKEQLAVAAAIEAEQSASKALEKARAELGASVERALESKQALEEATLSLNEMLASLDSTKEELLERLAVSDEWMTSAEASLEKANRDVTESSATSKERKLRVKELLETKPAGMTEEQAAKRAEDLATRLESVVEEGAGIGATLKADEEARKRRDELGVEIVRATDRVRVFRTLSDLIGSADGKKFRVFAQSLTLESLLAGANTHLKELAPRYLLERVPGHDLDIQVIDRDLADEVRSVNTLSGGESFLISLALALGLSSLAAKDVRVESLLVDEGFGSLDGDTLEVALSVLDSLQATGRKVGLISHVPGFAERVGAQVIVAPQGGGRSTVRVQGPMSYR